MSWSSPFPSTLNTGYITALDMCDICTKAVPSVVLWTRVTLQLWTCVKYVPKQSIPVALWTRVTLQLWTWVKYVLVQAVHAVAPFEHGLHYSFRHVWRMYRSSPFRSSLNRGYITALDRCEVCTEAVHSVALWTRVTLQLWTCVKYCTEAVCSIALWTRVTLQLWTCVYVPKQSIP